MPALTTLIRNGFLVDGTGEAGRPADVVVEGELISAVAPAGSIDPAQGQRVIDAVGLVLSPGFIDMHAHSDLQILLQPDHSPRSARASRPRCSARTGCPTRRSTTTVLAVLRRQIAGWNSDPARLRLLLAHASGSTSTGWTGSTRGIAGNAAYLVPRARCGRWCCGFGRAAGDADEHRGDAGDRARRDGAGRRRHVRRAHLHPRHVRRQRRARRAVPRSSAELGGFFAPHHRSYGKGALEAYAEMIDLTARRGLPAAPVARHDELRAEQGPRRRAAGHARRRRSPTAPTSPSTPTPTCPARPRCRPCCRAGRPRAGRTRRWPGCATRRRSPGSATTWRSTAPTAATAWSPSGTRSRSAASATGPSPAMSAGPSRRSQRSGTSHPSTSSWRS